MPYIKSEDRKDIEYEMASGFLPVAIDAGELNYLFTRIALEYINSDKLRYQAINDVIGALEGAKLEFYRRLAAPYEDTKIKENGDVY